MNPHIRVIIAAIIFGFGGVIVKYVNLPPLMIAFTRMSIPAIIFYIIIRKKKLFRHFKGLTILLSVLNAVRLPFYFLGIMLTSIGNAWIISYTYPLFVALYSIPLLKEKYTKKTFVALAVAISGVVVMFLQDLTLTGRDFIGMSSMLFSAVIYGLVFVLTKKVRSKYSKSESVFYQNIAGALLFLPVWFIFPFPDTIQVAGALTHGLLVGVVGFSMLIGALKHVKASVAGVLSYIEVVSAIVFGYIFLGEAITVNMLIGGSMILTAAYMIQRK